MPVRMQVTIGRRHINRQMASLKNFSLMNILAHHRFHTAIHHNDLVEHCMANVSAHRPCRCRGWHPIGSAAWLVQELRFRAPHTDEGLLLRRRVLPYRLLHPPSFPRTGRLPPHTLLEPQPETGWRGEGTDDVPTTMAAPPASASRPQACRPTEPFCGTIRSKFSTHSLSISE